MNDLAQKQLKSRAHSDMVRNAVIAVVVLALAWAMFA